MKLQEDRDALLAWAGTVKHHNKVTRSMGIIAAALSLASMPYVAFSCGKDSSVLAHMVHLVKPSVPLRFLSSGETRLVHDVDTVIDYFRGQGAAVEEINIDRIWTDEWKDATWTEQRKAGRGDLATLNGGYDLVFMGLRKEESRKREISLNRCRSDGYPSYTYRYTNADMVRCCPLADWTTVDIAAYICSRDMPVLDWYNYQGIEARTTARLTGDAVRQNVLVYIKHKEPGAFDRLAARFPEFRTFI